MCFFEVSDFGLTQHFSKDPYGEVREGLNSVKVRVTFSYNSSYILLRKHIIKFAEVVDSEVR